MTTIFRGDPPGDRACDPPEPCGHGIFRVRGVARREGSTSGARPATFSRLCATGDGTPRAWIFPACIEFARGADLAVYEDDYLEISFARPFDLITLWASIEHLHRLDRFLEKARDELKDGGRLTSPPAAGGAQFHAPLRQGLAVLQLSGAPLVFFPRGNEKTFGKVRLPDSAVRYLWQRLREAGLVPKENGRRHGQAAPHGRHDAGGGGEGVAPLPRSVA